MSQQNRLFLRNLAFFVFLDELAEHGREQLRVLLYSSERIVNVFLNIQGFLDFWFDDILKTLNGILRFLLGAGQVLNFGRLSFVSSFDVLVLGPELGQVLFEALHLSHDVSLIVGVLIVCLQLLIFEVLQLVHFFLQLLHLLSQGVLYRVVLEKLLLADL